MCKHFMYKFDKLPFKQTGLLFIYNSKGYKRCPVDVVTDASDKKINS